MVDASEADGRNVILLFGAVAVVLGGVLGAVVGAQTAERGVAVVVFGTVTLPSSGLAVGLYGAGLGVVVVGTLFAAVRGASRLERDA
ncbi:MAG: hypothetical protein ABEJ61_04835 [Haloferacaceae archaeon]